jgi:hypothetical protein
MCGGAVPRPFPFPLSLSIIYVTDVTDVTCIIGATHANHEHGERGGYRLSGHLGTSRDISGGLLK